MRVGFPKHSVTMGSVSTVVDTKQVFKSKVVAYFGCSTIGLSFCHIANVPIHFGVFPNYFMVRVPCNNTLLRGAELVNEFSV